MSTHRFYINPDDINRSIATITGQDAKHLFNVLRLKNGDKVELADGKGNHYLSEIESATSKKVSFKIVEKRYLDAESPAHITIAQGVLKDKKMDVILRHLTELGIKEWIPFFALRSVPCPDASHKKQTVFNIPKSGADKNMKDARVERWERIARESIKQCGRSILPIIYNPVTFDQMINQVSNYDHKIIFWEEAATPFDEIRQSANICDKSRSNPSEIKQSKIVVMIGPEGGFSKQEIDAAQQNGFQSFSLGKRILRAETASIAACALVQNIFGDLGREIE
ncbi:MAG: 16S rRNA (uracil(1498)-N(3))-methyltransferase [Desulfamplus sp.]